MKAVLILGTLALFSRSLGVPVNNEVKDEEMANKLLQKCAKHGLKRPKKHGKDEKLEGRIMKYLKSYGYMPVTAIRTIRKDKLEKGMWNFAVWNRAKIEKKLFMTRATPVFKRVLKRLLEKPRCGDPDMGKGIFGRKAGKKKRYIANSSWGKNTITYKIESFDNDLTNEIQRQEIAKAFKFWTDASALTVSEVQGSTTADINIRFVAGSHSDSAPFDGPGFVVAHAFYPEDGRIHFDRDEQFTTGGETGKVDLLSVAAHEIGHALGLGHSTESNSIMHAQYQPYSTGLGLSQDDIDGINFLYPSNNAGCVDEFWCEDILLSECSFFPGYCKNKCGTC